MATTVAVAIHEVPQEIGERAILVYGGFSKRRALTYNLLSALLAIPGAVTAFFFLGGSFLMKTFLVPITAGGLSTSLSWISCRNFIKYPATGSVRRRLPRCWPVLA